MMPPVQELSTYLRDLWERYQAAARRRATGMSDDWIPGWRTPPEDILPSHTPP
jgi:hypothetical protein